MKKNVAQLIFTILMLLLFMYTAFEAISFKKQASYFPLYISLLGILGMLIEIIRQLIVMRKESDNELLHPNFKAVIKYTIILVAYVVLVYVFGLIIATAGFLVLFLYYIAKMKLWRAAISVAILIVLVISFANLMNLYWPKSLINIL